MNVARKIETMSEFTMQLIFNCEEPKLLKEMTRAYKQQTCLYGFILGRTDAMILHEKNERRVRKDRDENLKRMKESQCDTWWKYHYVDPWKSEEVLLNTVSRTLHGSKDRWNLFRQVYTVKELLWELWDVTRGLKSPTDRVHDRFLLDAVKDMIEELCEFYGVKVDNAEPPVVGEPA